MKKKILIVLAALLVIGGAGGYAWYKHDQKVKEEHRLAYVKALNELTVSFRDELKVNEELTGTTFTPNAQGGKFEYAKGTVDPMIFVEEHGGELKLDVTEIDLSELKETAVVYHLETVDTYGNTVFRDVTKVFSVEDTQGPEITFKEESVSFTEGESFDEKANVESVKDPVDGDLEYTADSDVKADEPGEYTVTVKAEDNHGNKAEKSYTVTVKEKPAPQPVNPGGGGSSSGSTGGGSGDSAHPYALYVNCAANVVTAYAQDSEGNYTVPYKAMVCSTGPATPRGTYYTYDDPLNTRWSPRKPWWPLYGGVYGMYAYGIVDDILFHSVPYYSPDPGNLEWEEYNKLGTSASMGCVRLCVRDVMWIFNNCPHGTMVVFYDDASNPGPLGKPTPIYIDPSSPNRGWDPTDPNPENPWNN
ncbi:MAG: L,D-transpeptidase family protein [Erysipelotrichales bacterium]|nr:L,D-transpeptidase family protein [Erysipelotrichales bacterium]